MGQEASQLARQNAHLSDRVMNTFHAIDANQSGVLSVSEVTEFFRHADHLKGEAAQINAAHRFFYVSPLSPIRWEFHFLPMSYHLSSFVLPS